MAPKRTFGKSTSGPTATPQSNAPPGNGHRYDAAEKIWDGDPMTMSLWFVQTGGCGRAARGELGCDARAHILLPVAAVDAKPDDPAPLPTFDSWIDLPAL